MITDSHNNYTTGKPNKYTYNIEKQYDLHLQNHHRTKH